jgi:hypothetical protein
LPPAISILLSAVRAAGELDELPHIEAELVGTTRRISIDPSHFTKMKI